MMILAITPLINFFRVQQRGSCLPVSFPIPPTPLCVPFIPPPAICSPLPRDHGNCASSVAFHALPAALQKEACSNDLLHSSLAIIALTINSRLAFLCGGGGGDVSVGSLIRAPCNVSGSSSHPATSALPLLLPCLFLRCLPVFFLPPRMTDTECKSAPGLCFYPSGLQEAHECTFTCVT